MEHIFNHTTGLLHLGSSIAALVTGTVVLFMKKGTAAHRKAGYIYAGTMLVLLITAFMISHLTGGFGPFHIAAVISSVTLIAGLIPAILRKPKSSWIILHFSFMYWSVVGLYAAFAAETLTRVPAQPFWRMVIVATLAVCITGEIVFYKNKKRWAEEFSEQIK